MENQQKLGVYTAWFIRVALCVLRARRALGLRLLASGEIWSLGFRVRISSSGLECEFRLGGSGFLWAA